MGLGAGAGANLDGGDPFVFAEVGLELMVVEVVASFGLDVDGVEGDYCVGLAELPAFGVGGDVGHVLGVAAFYALVYPCFDGGDLEVGHSAVVGEGAVGVVGVPWGHLALLDDFFEDGFGPGADFFVAHEGHGSDFAGAVAVGAVFVEDGGYVVGVVDFADFGQGVCGCAVERY